MIIHSETRELAYCRLGDASWAYLESQFNCGFTDLVYSFTNQLFYGFTIDVDIEGWDFRDPTSPSRIGFDIKYCYADHLRAEKDLRHLCTEQHYLVESSCGAILHMVRYRGYLLPDGCIVHPDDYSAHELP